MPETSVSVSDFIIRRAEREDLPEMANLLTALARFEHLPPPDKAAQERLLNDGWGERPRFDAYLVFIPEHAQPVGVCVVFETYSTFLARPRLFVEDLFIHPDFRGRGLGGALIRHCLQLAHERGCARVECLGLDWNSHAHKVYEGLGAFPMHEWFLYRFEEKTIVTQLGIKRHNPPTLL